MKGYSIRYEKHDVNGYPYNANQPLPDITYGEMVRVAMKTSNLTGSRVTIVDDEGEEIMGIKTGRRINVV